LNTRFLIFNGSVEVTSSRLYVRVNYFLLQRERSCVHGETHSCSRGSSPPTDMSSLTKQILREY